MIEKLIKLNNGKGYVDNNNCHWDDEKSYLQEEILGFCGCGNPDDVMLYVKEFLERLEKGNYGEYSDMHYMFFVYWANDKGFAEHGTSVRCSWLTDEGMSLLSDINYCIK